MIGLEMKNGNMILIEKQQKYQHYYPGKLINMNILQVKKIFPSHERQIIEQTTITKSFWKTNKNDWQARIEGNIAKKIFDDFNNGIELFKKIQFGEIKLEDAKKTSRNQEEDLNQRAKSDIKKY